MLPGGEGSSGMARKTREKRDYEADMRPHPLPPEDATDEELKERGPAAEQTLLGVPPLDEEILEPKPGLRIVCIP